MIIMNILSPWDGTGTLQDPYTTKIFSVYEDTIHDYSDISAGVKNSTFDLNLVQIICDEVTATVIEQDPDYFVISSDTWGDI